MMPEKRNISVQAASRICLLFAFTLLAACSSAPAKKATDVAQNAVTSKTTASVIKVSAEAKDDFSAAMALVKSEDYDGAIALLNKVIKEAPQSAVPYINLALIYKKQGKLKPAEEKLKQALLAEPENPVAHNEYALLYRKTGRFSEARNLYEKILGLHPNFNIVHKNMGILCDLYLRDYSCALNHYVTYSNNVQDDKSVKIWIADLQKRLNK